MCTNRHKGHLDVMGPPNSYGNTQRMTLPVLKMRKLSSEKLSHFSEATQQESGRESSTPGDMDPKALIFPIKFYKANKL